MKLTTKISILCFVILGTVLGIIYITHPGIAYGNAAVLDSRCRTAVATTTRSVMSAGTATTTLYCDAGASGTNQAYDSAVLTIDMNASSTLSNLNWFYEYSQGVNGVDCTATPTACDWYADSITSQATSTSNSAVAVANSYSWKFASTTQGGAAGSLDRGLKVVNVPTPTRYIRVVFTLPVGSLNANIWASLVSKKQLP